MKNIMTRHKQQGVGIMEVLITLVVVSFGVLGMAGLQLTSMKHTTSGYNRAKAALFAEAVATRMRGNIEGVRGLHYAGLAVPDCSIPPSPYCQARPGASAESCTAAEMAVFDNFSIACGDLGSDGAAHNGVASDLLNGQMQIVCNDSPCTAFSSYTVAVTWDEVSERNPAGDSESKRVQIRFHP